MGWVQWLSRLGLKIGVSVSDKYIKLFSSSFTKHIFKESALYVCIFKTSSNFFIQKPIYQRPFCETTFLVLLLAPLASDGWCQQSKLWALSSQRKPNYQRLVATVSSSNLEIDKPWVSNQLEMLQSQPFCKDFGGPEMLMMRATKNTIVDGRLQVGGGEDIHKFGFRKIAMHVPSGKQTWIWTITRNKKCFVKNPRL